MLTFATTAKYSVTAKAWHTQGRHTQAGWVGCIEQEKCIAAPGPAAVAQLMPCLLLTVHAVRAVLTAAKTLKHQQCYFCMKAADLAGCGLLPCTAHFYMGVTASCST